MFSVEFDHDETKINIIDNSGFYGELELRIYDDIAYIEQTCPDTGELIRMTISVEMVNELFASFFRPEGLYVTKHR